MKKRTNEKPKKQKMRKNTNTQKVNKPDKQNNRYKNKITIQQSNPIQITTIRN
jgi:hypothetical protein